MNTLESLACSDSRHRLVRRFISVCVAALFLSSALPASAAKLIEAPPPPPMPENLPDEDEAPPRPAMPETVSLGRLLYENHCTGCHESGVHIRARRAVRSLPELRKQVTRWSDHARLQWSEEEVEAVVRYLNDRHYRF